MGIQAWILREGSLHSCIAHSNPRDGSHGEAAAPEQEGTRCPTEMAVSSSRGKAASLPKTRDIVLEFQRHRGEEQAPGTSMPSWAAQNSHKVEENLEFVHLI